MEWLVIVALIIIALTALKILMTTVNRREFFANYISKEEEGPDGIEIPLATFGQGLPLADMLTPATRVTNNSAGSCAAADTARQAELGGQFVQRTNNYKHDYPDHCSSLLSEFVGAFYEPKEGAVGSTVPCDGHC